MSANIFAQLSATPMLYAQLSQAPVVINDWVITIEDIEGGKRLVARRGSETQTMEIMDGAKGDKGDKGDPGYTPQKGVDYFDGEPGPQGEQGIPGADGAPGEPGASAYEIAVENGYDGTEEEWLESLKGEGNANVLTINVHLNPDRLVLDKSLDEIVAAHNAGYTIRAVYSNDVFSLTRARVYESGAWFIFATSDDSTRQILHISSGDDPQINSNVIVGLDDLPTHLPNPMPLVITGSTNALYNGDRGVFMRVADNWDDLRNKPFGTVGTEGVILDNYTALFNDESVAECIDIQLYLEDGVNYTVTFGGIPYTDTAKALTIEGSPLVYMGNPSVIGAGEDNGLPYMVAEVVYGGNYATAFYLDGAANSEVLVTVEAVPTLRKLDAQYLPESLGAVDASNAGKLLYVDSNGYLQPVTLGSGLTFVNGVLSVVANSSALGVAVLGQMMLGA